ncbi:MAG: hypothetical protein RLW61_12470 [Gammaproteobacteria bacterium]
MALVTSKFRPQGEFVARAEGMPGVPQVILPHPVAGIGMPAMAELAASITDELVARLRGERP